MTATTLRDLPLIDRKRRLAFSEHLTGDGLAVFAQPARWGSRGIVIEADRCAYRSGQSKTWLKGFWAGFGLYWMPSANTESLQHRITVVMCRGRKSSMHTI